MFPKSSKLSILHLTYKQIAFLFRLHNFHNKIEKHDDIFFFSLIDVILLLVLDIC